MPSLHQDRSFFARTPARRPLVHILQNRRVPGRIPSARLPPEIRAMDIHRLALFLSLVVAALLLLLNALIVVNGHSWLLSRYMQ
jgi:hypothetical protein